jgi:hypothetical protein
MHPIRVALVLTALIACQRGAAPSVPRPTALRTQPRDAPVPPMTDRLPTVAATYVRGVIGPSPLGPTPDTGLHARITFVLFRVDASAAQSFSVRAVEFLAADGAPIAPAYPLPPLSLDLLPAPRDGGVPA